MNVQDALKIVQCKKFTSSLPEAFNAPISHKVVTMKFQKKGMKVSGKVVCDLESLFARLLVVGGQRKVELSSLFKYELSPVPLSIIDDNGCLRKGNMSVLVQQLGIPVCNPQPPDVVIVDASQLIYHVVWPSSGTVADLAASMGHRLSCYNTQTFVIFDKKFRRCLPRTMRDKEEQGRAPQSTSSH